MGTRRILLLALLSLFLQGETYQASPPIISYSGGSGEIDILSDDSPIANTPHSALDFLPPLVASDEDGDEADAEWDPLLIEAITFGGGGNASNLWCWSLTGTNPCITWGSDQVALHSSLYLGYAKDLYFLDDDNSHYIRFQQPASIGTNRTCQLVDGGAPIPDSCVGDGVDAGGTPGEDSIGTTELDDDADTPGSGHYLRVDTVDQAGIEYRTPAEALGDLDAAQEGSVTDTYPCYWSSGNGVTCDAATVPNTKGGTGQSSSGWTGFAKVAAGVWSAVATIVTGDVEAELRTYTVHYNVTDPTTSDDGVYQAHIPYAADIERVYCSSSHLTNTATINLYERTEAGPNNGTTDLITTSLQCDNNGESTETFNDDQLAADSLLALAIDSETMATGDTVRVHVELTVD